MPRTYGSSGDEFTIRENYRNAMKGQQVQLTEQTILNIGRLFFLKALRNH